MPRDVTCPRCRTPFVIEDALAAVPVLELAGQDPSAPYAELVEDESIDERHGGPFAPEIASDAERDDSERTAQQRIVAALLLRSLADCKPTVIDHITAVLSNLLLVPFCVGVGFLVVLVLYYPLAGANRLVGGDKGGLLYLLPVGLLLVVSSFRKTGQAETIEAERNAGILTRVKLGRLHDTFRGGCGVTLLLIALLLGWQAALLYFAPTTCDLSFEPTAGQAWLLALDTVSLNNLIGALETFGVEVVRRQSSVWSDTVFQIFRLAYEALAVLFVYQLYQKWKWRRLLDSLPESFAGADAFGRWVDTTCRNEQAWPRRLFDELLFLLIAGLFVRGRKDEARGLAWRFPWLRVAADVRQLFRDQDGTDVFPPGGIEKSDRQKLSEPER